MMRTSPDKIVRLRPSAPTARLLSRSSESALRMGLVEIKRRTRKTPHVTLLKTRNKNPTGKVFSPFLSPPFFQLREDRTTRPRAMMRCNDFRRIDSSYRLQCTNRFQKD